MANFESDDEFMWGEAKRTVDKEKSFYSSFFYEDEEYRLYDNVFLRGANEFERHIGKIMKLWEERASGRKMVLVRWFLRPNELPPKLQGPDLENSKELFLAFGKGKGVMNENKLDAIDGKCKLLCTCKDRRNKQPSEDDLRNADNFFCRIYNVDRMRISNLDGIVDKLGCDVVFNKPGWVSEESEKPSADTDAGTATAYTALPGRTRFAGAVQGTAEGGSSAQANVPSSHGKLDNGFVGASQPESKKRVGESEVASEIHEKRLHSQHDVTRKGIAVTGLKRAILDPDEGKEKKKLKFSDIVKQESPREITPRYTGTSQLLQDGLVKVVPSEITSKYTGTSQMLPESSIKAAQLKEDLQSKQKGKPQILENRNPLIPSDTPSKAPGTSAMDSMTRKTEALLHQANPQLQFKEVATAKKVSFSNAIRPKDVKETEARKAMPAPTSAGRTDSTLGMQEKRRIFKVLPWDVNLQQGLPDGKVLHLHNLDLSFTSADIRDLLNHVFKGCSDAHVIPQGFASAAPYGEALVIFESKSFADLAFKELEDKCLVLTGSRRPLIVSKAKPPEPGRVARFPGHFPLDNFKLSRQHQNEEMRKAVATSHCSQPNTIEFEMAMEWQHHQEMAHGCWDRLYNIQRDDINAVLQKYKQLS